VRAFHDGLALTGEMGQLQEQVSDLQWRLAELSTERRLLTQVDEALGRVAADGGIDIDQRSSRLTQAIRHIFQFVDDEHEASATAILDGPMQRLSDAAFDAELVGHSLGRDLVTATQAAQRCREATAAAAVGLQHRIERMSPIHPEHSLVQALRDLLNDSPTRETATLRIIGAERRLPLAVELSAYRIVEEAVDNGMRHSHAAHIDVVLSFHRDRLVLVIKDDGEGFDLVATEARLGRTRALGLIEMKERAALAGGRCEVRSVSGAGSEVRATLPAR
jgi:two-component system sensor histidine kinase DegS